jgi:hypothetical protein
MNKEEEQTYVQNLLSEGWRHVRRSVRRRHMIWLTLVVVGALVAGLLTSGLLSVSLSCRKCGYEPKSFHEAAEHVIRRHWNGE